MVVYLFIVGLIGLAVVSRKSLFHPRAHGFYRFFAWVILYGMFLRNVSAWYSHPFAWHQIISWVLLVLSIILVVDGIILLRKIGQESQKRQDATLYSWERTARLVTIGLYRYIRHPLYSSLLFLGWGIYFKTPSWLDFGLVVLATGFLTLTARIEEGENIHYFGAAYREYKQKTKMFIPYIF